MMLHRYKKDKPSAESNTVLYHDPNRYPHDLPENPELETPFAKEVVLLIIYIPERIYNEEQHRDGFRNRRSNGRPFNSQSR